MKKVESNDNSTFNFPHSTFLKRFGVIGGDMRQIYCAAGLAEDGFGITLCGFDKCGTNGLPVGDIAETVKNSDALILPLPVSRNGKDLFAPLSSKDIEISDLLKAADERKPIFCGIPGQADMSCFSSFKLYYYGSREEFAAANAVPTAEGAVECAIKESDITICGSECLVIGYGRIGRVLSSFLHGMGADVTVSARKEKDMEFIKARGMHTGRIEDISGRFDFIFNTVPAIVLNEERLSVLADRDSLIVDLASMPGGVDDRAASEMRIRVIHALSLPGKVAPRTAGLIIKNTVYNIIREESL